MMRFFRPRSIVAHVFGAIIAAAILVVGVAYGYDRIVPIVVIRSEVLTNPEIKPGQSLYISFDVTRYRQCPVWVYQWIFDGQGIQFALAPVWIPKRPLGDDFVVFTVPIPLGAAPGRSRFHLAYEHECDVLGLWTSEHQISLPYAHFLIVSDET